MLMKQEKKANTKKESGSFYCNVAGLKSLGS